ncbi:hypothetical protein BYT27DRAFT_7181096 [Phlegmacium glaucopus]|nr:hypothetical protein BYT27DRAFT_7181096 [Phlegmacium glaucopus]
MYYNIVWIITCVQSDIVYLTFRKSDIVYSSSVAFLAIPNLVDISQNFILLSIGLSLSAVVMGFNAKLEENLLVLQGDLIQNPNVGTEKLMLLARIMEQHYTTVLLSVLCFFISVLVFAAYEVYSSVFVQKFFTVPYLFFLVATCGLIATAVVTLRWNRLVSSPSVDQNV